MNHPLLPACALACLLAAGAAQAQDPAQNPAQNPTQNHDSGAADPHAPVPATIYRGAVDYRAAPAPARPDRNWRASNDGVAATNSMALTMKPMKGHAMPADPHAGHTMPPAETPPATPPATPSEPQQAPMQAPMHHHHGDMQ